MAQRLIRTYALPVSEYNATIKCRDCEIFIGAGHEDEFPISAPDGPIFTLAMPQSDPAADRKRSASRRSFVKMEEDRP